MTKVRKRVKRTYASPLRDDHARATQAGIVDAAGALFAEKGYSAVSIDAIAERAGVGRATVFTSVGGKPALLKAAWAAAFARAAGGGEGVRLIDRPRSIEVGSEKSARGYIKGYAALATALFGHLARINEAMRDASSVDAEAKELFETTYAERRRGADRIVADVADRASLRKGIDPHDAADVVWVLNDPSVYYTLVHRRGWTTERYEAWLTRALEAELLPP
jgi:AcrR family transcriptional regulator